MADPVSNIEAELRRPVTLATASDHRKKLNESFSLLNPDQAAALLEKILTIEGSRLLHNFRRLDRTVRLALLLKLIVRLGTQTSAAFYARLTEHGTPSADPKLQKGLYMVFPTGTSALRDKFLKTLRKRPPTGIPIIRLEFRSHNESPSNDNECRLKKVGQMPDRLGLDPDPNSGQNWMEIRGTVSGHHSDAEYDFKRTKQKGEWYLREVKTKNGIEKIWANIAYDEAGTSDDRKDDDQDTHPDNDHIYVVDGPGIGEINPPPLYKIRIEHRSDVIEYVYILNAVETVRVRVHSGPWTRVRTLKWCSVTWLEKTEKSDRGRWRRKPGQNLILPGQIRGVSKENPPPEPFSPGAYSPEQS